MTDCLPAKTRLPTVSISASSITWNDTKELCHRIAEGAPSLTSGSGAASFQFRLQPWTKSHLGRAPSMPGLSCTVALGVVVRMMVTARFRGRYPLALQVVIVSLR